MAQYKIPAIVLTAAKTSNFTTGITLTSDVNDLIVDWGDGSVKESMTQNVEKTHNFLALGGNIYTIKIYTKSTSITKFVADASFLRSIKFNVSVNVTDLFRADSNLQLSSITFGNFNNTIAGSIRLNGCTGLSTLDFSKVKLSLTGVEAFYLQACTSLSSIIFKNDTNTISGYFTVQQSLLTTLDLSYVKITTIVFRVHECTLLENIIFKNDANTMSQDIFIYSNPKLTALDLSYVTITAALTRIDTNILLASITLKNAANTCNLSFNASGNALVNGFNSTYMNWAATAISLQNNGMNAAGVNLSLYTRNLDASTGGSLNIAGTNAAPDATSGGYDGLAAKTALIAKSVTVTTN